jgi:hypothetical protein
MERAAELKFLIEKLKEELSDQAIKLCAGI